MRGSAAPSPVTGPREGIELELNAWSQGKSGFDPGYTRKAIHLLVKGVDAAHPEGPRLREMDTVRERECWLILPKIQRVEERPRMVGLQTVHSEQLRDTDCDVGTIYHCSRFQNMHHFEDDRAGPIPVLFARGDFPKEPRRCWRMLWMIVEQMVDEDIRVKERLRGHISSNSLAASAAIDSATRLLSSPGSVGTFFA